MVFTGISRIRTSLIVISSVLSTEYFSMINMHGVWNYNAMHIFYNMYSSSVYISIVSPKLLIILTHFTLIV